MEKKKKKERETVNNAELVKQRPVLTEEEMNEFCTYEEAVQECMRLFDEEVRKIWREYDSKHRK